MSDVIACGRSCWGCTFDDHDANWHSWAGCDERGLPLAPGQVDPFTEQCGCYCQEGVDRESHHLTLRPAGRDSTLAKCSCGWECLTDSVSTHGRCRQHLATTQPHGTDRAPDADRSES